MLATRHSLLANATLFIYCSFSNTPKWTSISCAEKTRNTDRLYISPSCMTYQARFRSVNQARGYIHVPFVAAKFTDEDVRSKVCWPDTLLRRYCCSKEGVILFILVGSVNTTETTQSLLIHFLLLVWLSLSSLWKVAGSRRNIVFIACQAVTFCEKRCGQLSVAPSPHIPSQMFACNFISVQSCFRNPQNTFHNLNNITILITDVNIKKKSTL